MRHLICVLALSGCLDPSRGTRRGDDATCGRPLARIDGNVASFALGPCGAIAYWTDRERALVLVDAAQETVATFADPNGYGGEVYISPNGERVAAASLRSDLGFGDVMVGAFGRDFAVDETFDFSRDFEVRFDHDDQAAVLAFGDETWLHHEGAASVGPLDVLRGGERIFYMTRADDAVTVFDLASGTTRTVTALDRTWLDASTVSVRETFLASGDGARIVVVNECNEDYGAGGCGSSVYRILDGAGAELVAPTHWHDPRVGPGPLVAAHTDDGLVLFDDVRHDYPTTLAVQQLTLSPHAAAFVVGDTLVWFVDGAFVERTTTQAPWSIIHIDDDVLVAASPHGATLRDDAGREQRLGGCARDVTRRGGYLFYVRCDVNDELRRFDLATSVDALVAEGHDFDYQVDASGGFVAFEYLPLSATERELQAGAIDPR